MLKQTKRVLIKFLGLSIFIKPLALMMLKLTSLKMQLENVIALCRQHRSLSEAGRQLFAISRQEEAKTNDADRLRKYLSRYQLSWEQIQADTKPSP